MKSKQPVYMNQASGHGNMADKHRFLRCKKCDEKYKDEADFECPCGNKGDK